MSKFFINTNEIYLITNYLYKNIKNLQTKNNTTFTFIIDDLLNKNTIKNKHNFISLGYGEYIYKYNNHDIFITYREEDKPIACYTEPLYFIRLIIECDKEIFLDFYEKICTEEKKEVGNTNIYVCNKNGDWRSYSKIPSRNLNSIYIDDTIKNRLKNDIDNFLSSEKEYDNFGIPYKKIYLLTGIPGSGKTSLIKAICNDISYNLAILSSIKEMSSNGLITAFQTVESKTAILIEDIDCLFNKRKATSDNPSIAFSNLLNILDGVLFKHGIIVFITTNHPENLDKALLRPGRMDLIININLPRKEDITKLFYDLLNPYYDENQIKIQFNNFYGIIKNKNLTMSSIVNFLFIYRNKFLENIDYLIDTDNFIKSITKEENGNILYN